MNTNRLIIIEPQIDIFAQIEMAADDSIPLPQAKPKAVPVKAAPVAVMSIADALKLQQQQQQHQVKPRKNAWPPMKKKAKFEVVEEVSKEEEEEEDEDLEEYVFFFFISVIFDCFD